MGRGADFKIDLTQTFPHLEKAPILEAVIELRVRAKSIWEESAITLRRKRELREYPSALSITAQEFSFGAQIPRQLKHAT